MMQSADLVLIYVDSSGELKVHASDVEGRWQSNVNFVPARLTKEMGGVGMECRMMPWRKSAIPKVETSIVEAMNPLHLEAAKTIIKEKLKGVVVTVTEAGVVLTDPTALNRERVETAKIWLSLAGHHVALKSRLDAGVVS
jgi:hypothetical protein